MTETLPDPREPHLSTEPGEDDLERPSRKRAALAWARRRWRPGCFAVLLLAAWVVVFIVLPELQNLDALRFELAEAPAEERQQALAEARAQAFKSVLGEVFWLLAKLGLTLLLLVASVAAVRRLHRFTTRRRPFKRAALVLTAIAFAIARRLHRFFTRRSHQGDTMPKPPTPQTSPKHVATSPLLSHLRTKVEALAGKVGVNVNPGVTADDLRLHLKELGIADADKLDIKARSEADAFVITFSDAFTAKTGLEGLIRSSQVSSAGALADEFVHKSSDSMAYLTDELILVIEPPADVQAVIGEAKSMGYEHLRQIPYGRPETHHFIAKDFPGTEILAHAEALTLIDGVTAEPNMAGSSYTDGLSLSALSDSPPHDSWWDRDEVGARAAWKTLASSGRSALGVEMAIVDGSFARRPDLVLKDYLGDVDSFDFRTWRPEISSDLFPSASGHGLRAAALPRRATAISQARPPAAVYAWSSTPPPRWTCSICTFGWLAWTLGAHGRIFLASSPAEPT